jgi:NADH-quinone oxidoreductase subunit E
MLLFFIVLSFHRRLEKALPQLLVILVTPDGVSHACRGNNPADTLRLSKVLAPLERSAMHSPAERITQADQTFIDQVIAGRNGRPGALLGILEAAQERNPHKYLPLEILRYIAVKTDIPLSRIYSVATFYALFNLQPQGDNTICICRGTACHTRGSRSLLQSVRLELGLNLDDPADNEADKILLTTHDQKFTVRTVACFGQCALAPVVEVNHRICGHVNERTLQREIQNIERESE